MALLDDFRRFIADAEAGAQYAVWAAANPGELGRWQAFRDLILNGSRPAPPTMVTPHGRELIDAGIQYLNATAPPLPGNVKVYTGGDLSVFLGALRPGDSARLDAAGAFSQPITTGGTATAPIKVYCDPGKVQTLAGRLDKRGGATFWEWDNILFSDPAPVASGHEQSWVIGGTDNRWTRCGFTNGHTKIGVELIDDSTYGVARRNVFESCHVYGIGRMTTPLTNNDHGFYDIGYATHIVDTLIEDCSDRGLQARGGKQGLYEYLEIKDCGEGFILGDLGATGCLLRFSTLRDNRSPTRYLIETYGAQSGNTISDVYAVNKDGRKPIQPGINVTMVRVIEGEPPPTGYRPRTPVGPS